MASEPETISPPSSAGINVDPAKRRLSSLDERRSSMKRLFLNQETTFQTSEFNDKIDSYSDSSKIGNPQLFGAAASSLIHAQRFANKLMVAQDHHDASPPIQNSTSSPAASPQIKRKNSAWNVIRGSVRAHVQHDPTAATKGLEHLIKWDTDSHTAKEHVGKMPPNQVAKPEPAKKKKGPRVCYVSVRILSINQIDISECTFTAQLIMFQLWEDRDLMKRRKDMKEGKIPETEIDWSKEWSPNVTIANCTFVEEDFFTRHVSKNPKVVNLPKCPRPLILWARKVLARMEEQFELSWFPFDAQPLHICFRPMEGMNQTRLDIMPPHLSMFRNSLSGRAGEPIPEYELHYPDEKTVVDTVTLNRPYSMVVVRVRLRRRPGYYLWNVFFPLALIQLLACGTAYIPYFEVQQRLEQCTALVLTSIAFKWSVMGHLPNIEYMTQVDRFYMIGLIMLFTQFMEITVLFHCGDNNYLSPDQLQDIDTMFGYVLQTIVVSAAIRFSFQSAERMRTTEKAMMEMDKSWTGSKTLNSENQHTSAWAYSKAPELEHENDDDENEKEEDKGNAEQNSSKQEQRKTIEDNFLYGTMGGKRRSRKRSAVDDIEKSPAPQRRLPSFTRGRKMESVNTLLYIRRKSGTNESSTKEGEPNELKPKSRHKKTFQKMLRISKIKKIKRKRRSSASVVPPTPLVIPPSNNLPVIQVPDLIKIRNEAIEQSEQEMTTSMNQAVVIAKAAAEAAAAALTRCCTKKEPEIRDAKAVGNDLKLPPSTVKSPQKQVGKPPGQGLASPARGKGPGVDLAI